MHLVKSVTSQEESLSGVRILVTRPLEFSQYMVQQIERRGGQTVVLPTVEIVFNANSKALAQILSSENSFDWAIFSSRNAVLSVAHSLSANQLRWPLHLKCAAVGPKTAKEARNAFQLIHVSYPKERFGAKGLLDMDEMQHVDNSRMAVFDGGNGTGILLHELPKRCREVCHQVVYSRTIPKINVEPIKELIQNGFIKFVVITSVNGASNLFELLGAEVSKDLNKSIFVAYSERIKKFLCQQQISKVVVPPESSDDAVIELIQKYCI